MKRRSGPLALLVLAAVALAGLYGAPGAADAKKPKTTKIRHVGTFDGMPNSKVTFTLVKKGRKLTKAINVSVSGVELFCSDGKGTFSMRPFSTSFPNVKIGAALGSVGFSTDDLRLQEYTWGYKRIFGVIKARGKRASGDARIRFDEGEGYCGGAVVPWSSRAQ